jgi:hypothetical protein
MTKSSHPPLLCLRLGGVLMAAALLAGFLLAPGEALAQAAAPTPSQAPNGLDFSGLTPEQISTATQILGDTRCNCNCGMTLLECRTKDPNCSRSLSAARGLVADLKAGKDAATARTNLQAALAKAATAAPPAPPAPDMNKVFKIDTTGAPVKGPKSAPVTIVEFSDYQ